MSHKSLFINHNWLVGSGPLFDSHNPASGELVWSGAAASDSEVFQAVDAAKQAQADWAALPLHARIAFLERFKAILTKEAPALTDAICRETGKTRWDAHGEVTAMANKIAISIDAYHTRCPENAMKLSAGQLITRHKSHGVIAVFGPFNFPGHLPNGHIVPALLAGNTIVFKPSELAPLVAELTVHYWEKAGLPPGVLNLLQGGREVGHLLATAPGIDGLFFTGSWETGRLFSELFGKHPEKILALELGGNNPLVIGEVSDLKAAALVTIQSAYLSSGQRCSCARRLIVLQGKAGDQFIEELAKQIKQIQVGAYTDVPEPFMGPVISITAAHRLLAAQDALKKRGGLPLVSMHLIKPDTALLSPGLMDVTPISNRPDEEIFGPFLQLIRVPSFATAIKEANHTAFGLTAGLLSDDESQYQTFYKEINAGVINWNMPLTGASSSAPFGGIGRSGNHRPSAFYAADYCSYPIASIETKTVKMPDTLPPGLSP